MYQNVDVVIADGQSLSGEVRNTRNSDQRELVAIECPAGMEGATMTFQAATEAGGTFREVHDSDGTAVSVAVAADRVVVLKGEVAVMLGRLSYLKIRTGTAGAPTAQSGAATVRLHYA